MKLFQKLGFTALITASVSAASFAQMYGGVQLGYSTPTATNVIGTTITGTGSGTGQVSTNNYGAFGSGINFGLNAGYMFSEHFGFDLGASYTIASPVVTQETNTSSTTAGVTSTEKTTAKNSGSQIRITPSLVVSTGGEGIRPYARFGVVLPVAGETITDNSSVKTTGTTTYTTTSKATSAGQLSVGFNSAIGVNIGLGEKITVFGEVALTTLSIKAKSTTVTAYSSDIPTGFGPKSLDDLTFAQKNTNYVDKLDNTSNNNTFNPTVYGTTLPLTRVSGFDKEKAGDDLAKTANYNSIGLNVGLRYKF
jgi:Outer membrane protein beta-barrel domain